MSDGPHGDCTVSVQWPQSSGSFIPEVYVAFVLRETNYMMTKTRFLLLKQCSDKRESYGNTKYCK